MTLNNLKRIMGLVSILLLTMTAHAATITATWDFANVNPSSLSGVSIEGTQAHVTSTVSDVSMYVIAKYGKFAQRTSEVYPHRQIFCRQRRNDEQMQLCRIAGTRRLPCNNCKWQEKQCDNRCPG